MHAAAEALQHAELILFTDEPVALSAIEQYDQRYAPRQLSPPGAEGGGGSCGGAAAAAQLDLVTSGSAAPMSARAHPVLQPLQPAGGRPFTSALGPAAPPGAGLCGAPAAPGAALLRCRELMLVLLDCWGDSHFIGLSGLQVLGADRQPLPLAPPQVAADPPDLNVFPGHSGACRVGGLGESSMLSSRSEREQGRQRPCFWHACPCTTQTPLPPAGDVRTVDKLVDGVGNTTDGAGSLLLVTTGPAVSMLAPPHRSVTLLGMRCRYTHVAGPGPPPAGRRRRRSLPAAAAACGQRWRRPRRVARGGPAIQHCAAAAGPGGRCGGPSHPQLQQECCGQCAWSEAHGRAGRWV